MSPGERPRPALLFVTVTFPEMQEGFVCLFVCFWTKHQFLSSFSERVLNENQAVVLVIKSEQNVNKGLAGGLTCAAVKE